MLSPSLEKFKRHNMFDIRIVNQDQNRVVIRMVTNKSIATHTLPEIQPSSITDGSIKLQGNII